MNKRTRQIIIYSFIIITGLYFLLTGMSKARHFMVPFSLGILFSMILIPVDLKLRSWGLPKALAIIVSDLLLLAFSLGIFAVVGLQVQSISQNWPEYRQNLEPKISKVHSFIEKNTGISAEKQDEAIQRIVGKKSSGDSGNQTGNGIYHTLITFPQNFLLVFVYIFFFMFYREKFHKAILNFFPKEKKENADSVLRELTRVSRQYLAGRFLLMLILVVFYFIGLAIVGVRHAFLLSLLGALLNLIPYIGNVIAVILMVLISVVTQNSLQAIIGILVAFSVSQFVESYILEPYLVGHKVAVNPAVVFTGVIVGGFVWGLAGMILFIPLMGFLKVVFDHIKVLHPLGYVLDEEDTGAESGWAEQFIGWIGRIFRGRR